ncbi:DUF6844 domain-containing protein [Marinobacter salicampi]|uniref:DUF6844 domain-containing protein n=1 Tax=Marinobacter salicampi TaxID=435907 RepID=UPI0014099CE6|nr:hypothetical protein [Marinobacter salicampi]
MVFRRKVLSLLVAGAVGAAIVTSANAFAEEDLSAQVEASEQDVTKTPPSPFMAVSEVDAGDEKVQEFLEARGWIQGESEKNPGGGMLVVGSASVAADPSDISYSEARILATQEAFLGAMGELVSQNAVAVGARMTDRFMKDDLPEDVRDTTSIEAFGKAVAGRAAELTVQGLNSLLEELGADTSEMPEMSIAERKNMLYDEFVAETTKRAMGELSGVGIFGVIQEVGGSAVSDNGRVTVIVVKSERFAEFARQLRTGDVAPGQAIPVDDIQQRLAAQIKEKTPMLGYYGVQPMVDGQGRFGLVSFGMAGPQLVRGAMDEYDVAAELEASRKSANAMADAWLAQFASMTVKTDYEEIRRKLVQKVRETRGNGRTEIKTSTGVGKMINEVLQSEANVRLQGVQVVGQWNAQDPVTGHPYLGYVKYWSPSTSAKAQGIDKPAPEPKKSAATENAGKSGTERSVRSTGSFGEW